jgi:hypothetical protein
LRCPAAPVKTLRSGTGRLQDLAREAGRLQGRIEPAPLDLGQIAVTASVAGFGSSPEPAAYRATRESHELSALSALFALGRQFAPRRGY